MNNNDNIRYGWVCPKCGAVMSPDTKQCVNCSHSTVVCDGFPSGGIYSIPTTGTKPNYPPNISISTVDINDSKKYTITSEVEQ